MKKVQRLLSILIAGMAVIALCFLPTAYTDAITDNVTLTITSNKSTANIDREFTVTVSASRIENAAGLTFILKFDNTKVDYVSGTIKNLFADFVAANKTSNPSLTRFQSSASDASAAGGCLGFYFLNTAVTGGSTVNADTPLISATFRVKNAGDALFSIDLDTINTTCAQAAVVESGTPALVPVAASSATVKLTDNGPITGTIAVSIAGVPSEVSIPVVGNVLTAQVSGVPTNAGTLVYQWYRDNDPILNANTTTYTLASADIGKTLTVKAYSEEYSGIFSATTAKAVALRELVKSVTIEKRDPAANTNLVIGQSESLQLDAKVLDATATNRAVTWQSSGAAIATVDQNGLVTAKATGTTTITATARDGSGRRGSMTVSVVVPVTDIMITNAPAELLSGRGVTLTATALPINATKKTVTWTLAEADSAYAVINASTGLLQAKTGLEVRYTLTVTATAQDGFGITAVKKIDVVPVPISVTLSQVIGTETTALPAGATLPIDLGLPDKTLMLTAAVNPAPASQSVSWSSNNPTVATVTNGLVTGLRAGTAVITARTADGTKYASVTVNVGYTVHSLKIVGPSENPVVASGRSITLTVQFEPAAPTVKTVKWEIVSGGDYASVSTAGVVAGKTVAGPQDVLVRATATDGSGAYDDITVTVKPAATMVNIFYSDISMNGLTMNLDLASSQEPELIAGVLPLNAGQDVVWTAAPAGLVTLDTVTKPGVLIVKGLKPGVATITAATTDGTMRTANIRVNVTNLASEITISGPQAVAMGRAITLSAAVKAGTSAASNPRVTWSVQNGSEAYVAVNAYSGLVTGKSPTKAEEPAILQATATDGSGISNTYAVTVNPAATSVVIQKDSMDIPGQALGYEYNPVDEQIPLSLSAVVSPAGAGQNVTWRSSDLSVATPAGDGSGNFTIHTNVKRTAYITATTTDGTVRAATLRINITTLVQDVTITANAGLEVAAGRSIALTAAATPTTAANRAIVWTSSDTAVATVSYGTVTGRGVGTAVITATAADGSGKYASVEIKVNPLGTSVVLQKQGMDITGQTLGYAYNSAGGSEILDLSAVVGPIGAGQAVTWYTNNANIAAKVDEFGQFTIKTGTRGMAIITATAKDGSGRSATVRINVADLVSSVELSGSTEVAVFRSIRLAALVIGPITANKTVVWTSSDTTVATVSYGTVTGRKAGSATITATAADGSGKYASVEIKVNPLGTSVVLQKEGMDITGQTLGYAYNSAGGSEILDLSAVVGPIGAGQAVTWYTSNANIAAKVDEFGQFAIKSGTRGMAVITATAKDGSNRSATVRINVADLVSSVELNGPNEVAMYRSIRLAALVTGPITANKTVIWTSSDTTVATVSYGTVTGRKAGSATITATAADGSGMSDSITIAVKAVAVTSVILQKGGETVTNQLFSLDLAGVNTMDFDALTGPDSASPNIEWISSAPTIATVDKDGIVTGVKSGMVTITARAADGSGRVAYVRVNVVYLAKNVTITLPATGDTVTAGMSIRLIAQTDAGATNKSIVWSSSDTNVATVVGGTVTAKAMLKDTPVTITATAADGGGAKAEVTIIVKPVIIPVSIVEHRLDAAKEPVTGRTLSFDLGKEGSQLQLGAEAMSGEPLSVTWTVSPIGIITVNADGLIERAIDPITGNPTNRTGIVTVTATTTDGTRKTGIVRISVATLAKTITVSPATAEIAVGRSVRLAAATDAAATNKALLWSSSDTKIATVYYGTVTGRAVGTAFITVKSADGGTEVQVPITVKPGATSVVIQKNGTAIPGQALGYEYNPIDDQILLSLSAVISPADAGQTVTWRSSDVSVATSAGDGSGNFTIHTNVKRTAYITATTTDGTVRATTLRINITTLVQNVTITANAGLEVAVGRSIALSAAATPITAANRAVVWTSSNTAVATVSYGTVTGRSAGTAVITATAADGSGKSASVEIKVNPLATSVVLQKDSTNITGQTLGYAYIVGGGTVTLDLGAAVNPIGAGQNVTWNSNNINIAAKANENGQFIIKTGTRGVAVITAIAKDGSGRSATVRINVADLVSSVELSGSTEVALNRSIRLTAVVTGPATANKAVIWTSSDPTVATVSYGTVTGRKAGSATITAAAADGSGMSGSITVTVKAVAATSVTLQKGGETVTNQLFNLDLAGVNTIDFDALTGPDGASPNIEWISSAPTAASVSNTGVVTGLRNGMITITARAADGSYRSAYVRVNVTTLVHEIKLTGPNSIDGTGTVTGGMTYQLTPVVTAGAFTPVNKNVKWSIQGSSLAATVDTRGMVTTRNVRNPITVTIIATASDGSGVKASFVLTISPPVS